MTSTPRLERSRSDCMIAGVCGGIARYLNTDPAIVRLVFVLLALSGPAFLVYPLLWIVMPREAAPTAGSPGAAPGQVFVATGETQRLRIDPATGQPAEPEQEIPINNLGQDSSRPAQSSPSSRLLGYALLGLGSIIALQMIWPGASGLIFPALLIGAGIYLLRRS